MKGVLVKAKGLILQLEEREKKAKEEAAKRVEPKKLSIELTKKVRETVRREVFMFQKQYLVNDHDWKEKPDWINKAMEEAGIPASQFEAYHADALSKCRSSINDKRNDLAKKFRQYINGKMMEASFVHFMTMVVSLQRKDLQARTFFYSPSCFHSGSPASHS